MAMNSDDRQDKAQDMTSLLTKTDALILAAGCFMILVPAYAISSVTFSNTAMVVTPVVDEQKAIEQQERPNEVPPGDTGARETGQANPQAGSGSGQDEEVQELQRAFPSTNWPPSMRNKEE
jgi:hypothetical protein